MNVEMIEDTVDAQTTIQTTSIALVQGAMVEFDKVAAGLADLRGKYANVVFDVGTTAGMSEAKAARIAIREPRYAVDKVLKATKDPLNAIKRELDERAGHITAELLLIEIPIHEQIKAEEDRKAAEKAERERLAAEQKLKVDQSLEWIRNHTIKAVGKSVVQIDHLVMSLETLEITLEDYGDRAGEAEQCRVLTLGTVAEVRAAAVAQEAAAAELAEAQRKMEQERKEQAEIAAQVAAVAAAKAAAEQAELDEKRRAFQQEQADARRAEQERAEKEAADRKALDDERAAFEAEKAAKPEVKPMEMEVGKIDGFRIINSAGDVSEVIGDVEHRIAPMEPAAGVAEVIAGPCDGDIIFCAARAVATDFDMTIDQAIERLAGITGWVISYEKETA